MKFSTKNITSIEEIKNKLGQQVFVKKQSVKELTFIYQNTTLSIAQKKDNTFEVQVNAPTWLFVVGGCSALAFFIHPVGAMLPVLVFLIAGNIYNASKNGLKKELVDLITSED